MSQTENNEEFALRLKKRLQNDAPALDAATRSRLNQARQAALRELDRPAWSSLAGRGSWMTAGGAVAAGVMVALLLRQGGVAPELPAYAPAEDIEIILSEGDLELYDELEFYTWVAMQSEAS